MDICGRFTCSKHPSSLQIEAWAELMSCWIEWVSWWLIAWKRPKIARLNRLYGGHTSWVRWDPGIGRSPNLFTDPKIIQLWLVAHDTHFECNLKGKSHLISPLKFCWRIVKSRAQLNDLVQLHEYYRHKLDTVNQVGKYIYCIYSYTILHSFAYIF